jgi:hypothetical protein
VVGTLGVIAFATACGDADRGIGGAASASDESAQSTISTATATTAALSASPETGEFVATYLPEGIEPLATQTYTNPLGEAVQRTSFGTELDPTVPLDFMVVTWIGDSVDHRLNTARATEGERLHRVNGFEAIAYDTFGDWTNLIWSEGPRLTISVNGWRATDDELVRIAEGLEAS